MATKISTKGNHHATYWRYTGNHHNGRDCERRNPHGYFLEVISFLAHWAENPDDLPPLTPDDTKKIKVTHHHRRRALAGQSFGYEISVAAPPDVWHRAGLALQALQETISGSDDENDNKNKAVILSKTAIKTRAV